MKHFGLFVAAVFIVLYGCSHKITKLENTVENGVNDCAAACAKITPSDSANQITSADLEKGSYYGELSQKKKGTPDNWIHTLEGSRSAMWVSPENAVNYKCDCGK